MQSSVFQFYYSAIKTDGGASADHIKYIFQFYYSAIKTPPRRGLAIKLDDFNSTIVRLKRDEPACTRLQTDDFNSTIVRLKRNCRKRNGI